MSERKLSRLLAHPDLIPQYDNLSREDFEAVNYTRSLRADKAERAMRFGYEPVSEYFDLYRLKRKSF